ncbi:GTPase IMAP family member 9-like isoform X1 [Anguilla anguilla]|uniref:GTPase IMAP family member 9-like isoform X1 n=1 Tax=Anguilla anguilla TaxID=7936 RepID=UPI0015AA1513|nr:GTPase IMAP family member 9-like isoform X1 [Anguilla anguilla]
MIKNQWVGRHSSGGSADLRIVLLGNTGAGRSSAANSILGEKLFKTSCSANPQTVECEAKTKTVGGRSITVIDTPGFLDDKNPGEALNPKIVECIRECSARPHTFVMVLKTSKQTAEELRVMKRFEDCFGEEALKYVVVLFTHGDQLDDRTTIKQFVNKNERLKTLVQKCGNRFYVIDNKYWNNPTEGHNDERSNAAQIKKLLNTIDQMMKQNRGQDYTKEMLRIVEKAQSGGQAKPVQNVMKMFLKTGAGVLLFLTVWYAHTTISHDTCRAIAKGALLMAIFGAGAYVTIPILFPEKPKEKGN